MGIAVSKETANALTHASGVLSRANSDGKAGLFQTLKPVRRLFCPSQSSMSTQSQLCLLPGNPCFGCVQHQRFVEDGDIVSLILHPGFEFPE